MPKTYLVWDGFAYWAQATMVVRCPVRADGSLTIAARTMVRPQDFDVLPPHLREMTWDLRDMAANAF